jgi:hypothetical protein
MKTKLHKFIILVVLSMITLWSYAQEQDILKEKELIKEVIQSAYVDGLCNNADEEAVYKGFHPGFYLLGIGPVNTIVQLPIYNWIEYAKKGKRSGLKYSFQNELTTIKFQFIDVSGTAAVAKIDFFEGDKLKFNDYLSLLKFKDGWKIVCKTYYAIPEESKKE